MDTYQLFRSKKFIIIFVLVCFFISFIQSHFNTDARYTASTSGYAVSESNQLPLYFEKNIGQVDESIGFYLRNHHYSIQLEKTGFITHFNKSGLSKERGVVSTTFLNANTDVNLVGTNKLAGSVNYLLGNNEANWYTEVPIYGQVSVEDVYSGIDLRYYSSSQQRLEYDFIVSPDAALNDIQIGFDGVDLLSINDNGDLIITTQHNELMHKKPIVFQEIDGERHYVDGQYQIIDSNTIGFQVAAYDKNHVLVIDPIVDYATYFGGELEDKGLAIAVDDTGSVYLAGTTQSTLLSTNNAYQGTLNGTRDAFIAKLSPSGDALVYATYFGVVAMKAVVITMTVMMM